MGGHPGLRGYLRVWRLWRRRLLLAAPLISLLLPALAVAQEEVIIPEPDGVQLQARVFLPAHVTAPAIIALHGCGGPFKKRDDQWAKLLVGQGHAVILPNSFASRGVPGECRDASHKVSAYRERRNDALAAATWAMAQKFAPPGGVLLLGWSDGGTTVLATVNNPPPGLIRGAVAFYPACTRLSKHPDWHPAVPLLILMGAQDDWTPAASCQLLAARNPAIHLTLYPGAYHDFDVPDDPVHLITGLPYTRNGDGVAHVGENPLARDAALAAVPAFFDRLK